MAGGGLLPRGRNKRQAAVRDRHPAAQRHRRVAHGPRPEQHPARHPGALAADGGRRGSVDARDGPRRDRHPERGGASARRRGERPPRPRPRRLHRAGMAVEGREGRSNPRPTPAAWRLVRLAARPLHHGRGALQGGARGLRSPLRGGADLQGELPGELVPALPHRPVRSGGGARGGEGRLLPPPLPGGLHRRDRGDRHHPPGDPARRHGSGGPPGRSALHPFARCPRDPAAPRPADPGHCGRLRGAELRHRGSQGHPGPRSKRLPVGPHAPP